MALKNIGLVEAKIQIDERTNDNQFFFNILNLENQTMFNIDLGIKQNPWHIKYELKNGLIIYGQTVSKIFWDKICVVSTDIVNIRPWDVFDMYLLSLRRDLRMSEILKVKDGTGRELGDFQAFLYPSDKLRSAWKRRRYISDRPEFDKMFGRVRDLCTPLIWGGLGAATWNPDMGFWYEGEKGKDKILTESTIFVGKH